MCSGHVLHMYEQNRCESVSVCVWEGWGVGRVLKSSESGPFSTLKIVDLSFLLDKIFSKCQHNLVFPGNFFLFLQPLFLSLSLTICLSPSVMLFVHQYAHRVQSHFHVQPRDFTVQPSGTDQIYRYVLARLMRAFRVSLHSCTWDPCLLH